MYNRKTMRRVLFGGTALLLLVFGIVMICQHSVFQKAYGKRMDNLKSLQQTYQTLNKKQQNMRDTEEDMSAKVHSAKDAGDAVSQLQRDYEVWAIKNSSSDANKPSAEELTNEVNELNERSEAFFGKGSSLQGIWYSPDKNRLLDVEPWIFRSNYNFTSDSITVIWTKSCSEGLLAYVMAEYDPEHNTFSEAHKYQTMLGNYYEPYTGSLKEQVDKNPDTVLSLMDDMGLDDDYQKRYDEMINDPNRQQLNDDMAKAKDALKNSMEKEQ